MALNACSLHDFAINGRNCTSKFDRLVPILHPPRPVGAGAGTPHTKAVYDAYLRRRPPEKWEAPQLPTELERIVVEASFLTLKGSDAQDVRPGIELVTVTDIQVDQAEVNVNIQDLRFNHADDSST